MLPVNCFVVVFFLLHLEDVLHKELLQVFVGEVDAKLLETVGVEILEAENIEHTDCTFVTEFDI